jgi:hypothetical protein
MKNALKNSYQSFYRRPPKFRHSAPADAKFFKVYRKNSDSCSLVSILDQGYTIC